MIQPLVFGGITQNQQRRLLGLAFVGPIGAVEIPPGSILKPGDTLLLEDVHHAQAGGKLSYDVLVDGAPLALGKTTVAAGLLLVEASVMLAPGNTADVLVRLINSKNAAGGELEIGTPYGGGASTTSALFIRGVSFWPQKQHDIQLSFSGPELVFVRRAVSTNLYS